MSEMESMFKGQMNDDGYTMDIQKYTKIRDGSHLYTVMMRKGKRSNGNGQHNGSESDTKRVFSVGEGSGR